MGFQKSVSLEIAKGVAGSIEGLNPAVMALPVPVAADTGVKAGLAAWYDSDRKVKNAGSGKPLGFVVRVKDAVIATGDEYTMTYAKGQGVAVLVKGDILLSSGTAVTAGQKVFANLTTGEVKGAAAESSQSGFIETDFVVKESANAGTVFVASNW